MTATMASASDRVMLAIHEIERGWVGAGYVLGGEGVSPRLRPRPGIHVCRRVSDVVDAADAVVKRRRAQLSAVRTATIAHIAASAFPSSVSSGAGVFQPSSTIAGARRKSPILSSRCGHSHAIPSA